MWRIAPRRIKTKRGRRKLSRSIVELAANVYTLMQFVHITVTCVKSCDLRDLGSEPSPYLVTYYRL